MVKVNFLINLFQDYQKVFDMDRSSHVAREALMVNDFVLSTVVYWQCYELLNTIYLSLYAMFITYILLRITDLWEWTDNLMSVRRLLSFFSLLSEETSWTNKSQAWKNERGNDRYVLKKVLMPFTRYLHLLNIVCIAYPLHHVSIAITMNTMYKCTSCQSHQIVSLLNFLGNSKDLELCELWHKYKYSTYMYVKGVSFFGM